MIKIENIEIYGWETAIRGMRNPLNSWEKSDSHKSVNTWNGYEESYIIGENDLTLMRRLANAGSDHGKFLRMITVTMDITAPLYWWKEFDTYKVGTVANSCSTMHKIHAQPFTPFDFSWEHLYEKYDVDDLGSNELCTSLIELLNNYRERYLATKSKRDWWQLIQLLPSSYNQRRTVQLNYAVLRSIYPARENHKLDEWHTFCHMIRSLPYAKELIYG